MSYEIVPTGKSEVLNFLHITSTIFKDRKVWRIQFHDGKEVILYKCGYSWQQSSIHHIDKPSLQAIGQCIDGTGKEKACLPFDSYFYNMLMNEKYQ